MGANFQMGANSIIVKEYLESLKEDKELDYLFPLLLSLMGFEVITTAKESKGQSQYGKDVVAIGKDENGKTWRYYFQIKAGDAKDINDRTFNDENGIRSSLLQAKDTLLIDSTRVDFSSLPIKIILVHPGILKENFRPVFEGFIKQNFKEDEFEHWNIYKLISLFEEYLFNECLLIDNESYKLFKKLLVLLDAPGSDFKDIHLLLDHLIKNHAALSGRKFQKFFASFHLIAAVILQFSKEANNLHAARECLTVLLLKVWAWILRSKLETDKFALGEFRKLLKIHYDCLDLYFHKTFSIAVSKNGLFAERAGMYETIGYPVRSFEYLSYLLYYFHAMPYSFDFESAVPGLDIPKLRNTQKEALISLISSNDGCSRPLIDYHSIPIVILFLFFAEEEILETHLAFIANYLINVLDNILLVKSVAKRYPMLGTNLKILAEYSVEEKKPNEYLDKTSILIPTVFELISVINHEYVYGRYKNKFDKELSLQIPHPLKGMDFEQKIFDGYADNAYYVEAFVEGFPATLKEYRDKLINSKADQIAFRTDAAGFPFLRLLAHLYYKNELTPFEWRKWLKNSGSANT
ncbi:MAG: hypothetical protein JWO06_1875 [Bacteroidota bacterium]|nr:hypothetical protein [Bacteroidota bacterium]